MLFLVFSQKKRNLCNVKRIQLYQIHDRSITNIFIDGQFYSEEDRIKYISQGEFKSLEIRDDTVTKLKILKELWSGKNISIVVTNATIIYAIILHDKFEYGLTPYRKKNINIADLLLVQP